MHAIPFAVIAGAVVCLWPCQAEDPTRNQLAVALHQISSGCAALGDADANRISGLIPDAGSLRQGVRFSTVLQVLVACRQLLQQLPAPTLPPLQTHIVDEVESLGREVRRLSDVAAQCEQQHANKTSAQEERDVDVEIEWLMLPHPSFPVLFVAIALAVLCPVIGFWEACIVPKTTLFHKLKVKEEAEIKMELSRMDTDVSDGTATEALEPLDRPWKTSDEERFWKKVEESCVAGEDVCATQECTGGQVGFARFEYITLEGNDVNISVARSGSMKGTLEVTLKTRDANTSGYNAVAGIDFVSVKQRIRFADGETFKEVPLEIPVSTDHWKPTRWFLVELTDVSEGFEVVGPSMVFDQEFKNEGKSTCARVFILQQESWPADLETDARKKWSGLWLVLFYIKERIHSRKRKFWKTLLALLYEPVHDIVVTTIVQKLLIDWATHPDREGFSGWIVLMAALQAISTGLLRYTDVVQRLDRGRTGGCRQEHRWQLLSKLLMMDFDDHLKFPGSKWFYTALVDVNVIVADGYWQFYMLITYIFALVLTLGMLLWSELSRAGKLSWEKFIPFVAFIMVLPISIYVIYKRTNIIKKGLEERMDRERAWVDTFSWITQSGSRLYSLRPGELARLERSFTAESKVFVNRHQNARDIIEDSVWVTRYLGYFLYCIFVAWAAIQLADGRQHIAAGGVPEMFFGPGDFVVAARIYGKFGKYLTLLIDTGVKMLKASVSVERVAELLNLPEHSGKFLAAQRDKELPYLAPDCAAKRGKVQLEYANFDPEQKGSDCPMGRLDLSKTVLEFPLGKVIYVRGGTEPEQLTLMAITAGILNPTRGARVCPANVQPAMLSSTPLGCTHTTVAEALQLAGLSLRVATRLARALGIDPAHETERLGPAQMQAMALMRVLISNPEMIVTVRPLSVMGRVYQRRMAHLLRAWQLGVMPRTILSWLAEHDEEAPSKRGPARTLVITGEEFFKAASTDGSECLPDMTVRLDTREWQSADWTQSFDSRTVPTPAHERLVETKRHSEFSPEEWSVECFNEDWSVPNSLGQRISPVAFEESNV